jgi:hypothetical protein
MTDNIKQYPIAIEEDTNEVALILAANFTDQTLALIQPDEDGTTSIVVFDTACFSSMFQILTTIVDPNGNLTEDKVVN